MPKHSVFSIDTSFLRSHILLPLYWHSLPPILLLTPRSTFDTWLEISVFPPYSSWKTVVWERIANFEQVSWNSFCLNYPDLLLSKQFTEDTPIDKISHWFVYSCHNPFQVTWNLFGRILFNHKACIWNAKNNCLPNKFHSPEMDGNKCKQKDSWFCQLVNSGPFLKLSLILTNPPPTVPFCLGSLSKLTRLRSHSNFHSIKEWMMSRAEWIHLAVSPFE